MLSSLFCFLIYLHCAFDCVVFKFIYKLTFVVCYLWNGQVIYAFCIFKEAQRKKNDRSEKQFLSLPHPPVPWPPFLEASDVTGSVMVTFQGYHG